MFYPVTGRYENDRAVLADALRMGVCHARTDQSNGHKTLSKLPSESVTVKLMSPLDMAAHVRQPSTPLYGRLSRGPPVQAMLFIPLGIANALTAQLFDG